MTNPIETQTVAVVLEKVVDGLPSRHLHMMMNAQAGVFRKDSASSAKKEVKKDMGS